MFRTQKDINETFFPKLDESKETWTVLHKKYEQSNYGRVRYFNGKQLTPNDDGVYELIVDFKTILVSCKTVDETVETIHKDKPVKKHKRNNNNR